MPERESLVTILLQPSEFEPSEFGTEFTLQHEHFFATAARDRHELGWTGALTKLHLAQCVE